MSRHRTTARGILFLLSTVIAAALVVAPGGAAPKPDPIVFPLIGDVAVDDNYGDPRANGSHAGIDMMTPRRTPVVASENGRVKWWTTSSRAGCMLYLYGASGTTYLYIHLNNDRTLRNDNEGGCVASETYTVANGAKVTAGQQIAWSGDSGDADGNPHLHFELHPDHGADVNPYRYLVEATRHLFPARIGTKTSVGLRGTVVAAGEGRLTIRAASVRWWPGGRWTALSPRAIELEVDDQAEVDRELATWLAGDQRVVSQKDDRTFTAFTVPARATLAAMRGAPGALAVRRVTRPGGSVVVPEPDDDPPVDDGEWTPPWQDDRVRSNR